LSAKPDRQAENLLDLGSMNARSPVAPELAVVMPIYNEETSISAVLREWFDCLRIVCPNFTVLAINDGSTDGTGKILASLGEEFGSQLRVLNKANSGHGMSCREGYEIALAGGAEWIFQTDSDGQCDPVFFYTLFRHRSQYDCVFGYRRSRDDGAARKFVSWGCRLLVWFVSGSYLKDPNVPYRLIRAGVLRKALRRVPVDLDLQNIGLAVALNRESDLRWKYFPIHFRARQGGKSCINYSTILRTGLNLFRDLRCITHPNATSSWRFPKSVVAGPAR
jgi:glycosyltransferase involved in cell wall biosynthesis